MKDWLNVLPDRVRLIPWHFTPGRAGRKIRHVTVQSTIAITFGFLAKLPVTIRSIREAKSDSSFGIGTLHGGMPT